MKILLNLQPWIAAAVAFAVMAGPPPRAASPSSAPGALPPQPEETLSADPVDGEPVAEELSSRRNLAVVIENFPDARPQWGLSLASRVYEAITEGGITRYLAIFGPNYDADRVGPVRSARTQFLDYALELDAALAHAGGNEDALALIQALHLKDLDEFRYAAAYRRIPRRRVALEHTMFASTRALRALVDRAGSGGKAAIGHPAWKDDVPYDLRSSSQKVTIDFSFPAYRVVWLYRRSSNDYQRVLAGVADVDAATGAPVTAKSIAIVVVPRAHGRTPIGEDTWTFSDTGSGRAWVLQDGALTEGAWQKPTRADRLRLLDANAQEMKLDRGPQWIEIIPPEVAPAFEPSTATQ